MSNPTEKGVRDKHFSCKRVFCDQCGVCRYCDAPPYFQSRINNKHFRIHIQSEIEQKKIKFNITTIYHGRDRINLIDELDLCDGGNILSKKDK